VPVRFTVCGLLAAASVSVRVPVRVPIWLGMKTTLTTHFAAGASRTPLHPSLDIEKSPAEAMTLSICSAKLFGLVSVTFLGAEVESTSCFANESESGLIVNLATAAYAGAVPILSRIRVAISATAANLPKRAAACLMLASSECLERESIKA
jgi:hypothetical protein